jgi:hypothetical protein
MKLHAELSAIITLTKQAQHIDQAGQAGGNGELRLASLDPFESLLRSPLVEPSASRAFPPDLYREPVVSVLVSGARLELPALALNEGLSDLRLATGVCVNQADYALGVCLVLKALAKSCALEGLAEQLVRL